MSGQAVKCAGLTLVELLTTLAVAGILVASASGGAGHLLGQHRASASVNQMLGAIRFARHAAVAHRSPATLCPADGAQSLQPGSPRGNPSQESAGEPEGQPLARKVRPAQHLAQRRVGVSRQKRQRTL